MTDMNIATLYRQLTGGGARQISPELDADALLAVSDAPLEPGRKAAVVRALATAPAESAIVRMLKALRSESEELALGMAAIAQEPSRISHPQRSAVPRHAPATRRTQRAHVNRWSALAACMVAVLGMWSWQHTADVRRETALDQQAMQDAAVAHQLSVSRDSVASRGDIIFTTRDGIFHGGMDVRGAQGKSGDQLFQGGFNG